MLLKYSQYQRRNKLGANGKPHRGSVTGSRIPNKGKGCRKGKIVSSKRLNGQKNYVAKREEEASRVSVMTVDPVCDNSNDSGLGFDHVDQPSSYLPHSTSFNNNTYWNEDARNAKRQRVDIKLESDNANDNFTFPQAITLQQPPQRIFVERVRKGEATKGKINGGKISSGKINSGKIGGKAGRSVGKRGVSDNNATARSRDGTVCLEILSQPENQHRARYQTEGSRGAVKDTSGNSFPLVKLSGYSANEPAVLQVYIGTDQGKVAPHMFYQACKVSGKNSTPCVEKKLDGTVVIEIEFEPSKDNLILCDCVGILKERNVDVEHRFPEEVTARSRKKSTRCRMVFKTTITLPNGQTETLQVISHPIACTQPPGIPEICKKSLSSCPVTGNTELFIIGKNFLKDTKVKFSEGDPSSQDYWECVVQPDKEYLHQSHLVCTVPRYRSEDIKKACNISVSVVSGGKSSEPVYFSYTPIGTFPSQHMSVIPTSPSNSTSTSSSTPFFAVTQNLATTNQTILQAVTDSSSFTSPQKILIIPSNMDLSTSVPPTSLPPDNKDLLKTEDVWIKEEMGVVQGMPQTSGLIQSPNLASGLNLAQAPSLASSLSLVQAPSLASSLELVQTPSLASSLDLVETPNLVPSSNLVQAPSLDLVQAAGLVQSSSPSLTQSTSSPDNIDVLRVSPVSSGMIQSSSSSSTPSLLQDNSVSQQSNLLGVSQTSPLLQVSAEMVHASSVLQTSPSSISHHSSPGVLLSPELSPVTTPSSPVFQTSLSQNSPPLQNTLSKSPEMDTLSQASSLVHSIVNGSGIVQTQTSLADSPVLDTLSQTNSLVHDIVTGSNLVQTRNMVGSDLIASPQSQNIDGTAGIVSSLGSLMSPPLESPSNMIQGSPMLVKSPSMVLSSNMVHSQSPTPEISSPPAILQPPNMMERNNLSNVGLLPDSTLNNSSGLIPVTTIPEATSIIQNNSIIETNPMVQNNSMVNSAALMNTTIPSNISNTPIGERTNILQDPSCNTSVARGLESATPGGAANAVADLNSGQVPSMATIEKFVTATPLPSLSVETYLSHIENKPKVNDIVNTFPTPPPSENSPIAIKQMVAAALEPKTEPIMTFPGEIIRNINNEVIHNNPVLLTSSETSSSHINFQTPQEFLTPQQTNMQLLPGSDGQRQTFASSQFPPTQIFPPPPLYQESTPPQDKPKPPPSPAPNTKKCEEGIPVPHELTVMSETDLISYINPSCFDQGNYYCAY